MRSAHPERGFHDVVATSLKQRAAVDPDGLALAGSFGTTSNAELCSLVGKAAAQLRERGIGVGTPVVLSGHKEPELIAAYLACLAEGLPVVPLDRQFPQHWRSEVVRALDRPPVWLGSAADVASAADAIPLDELCRAPGEWPPARDLDPAMAAVVMKTSGSTGKPKLVTISRANLAASFATLRELLGLGPGDVMLNPASISFSSSLRQAIHPLLAGAASVLLERADLADAHRLLQLQAHHRVTVAELVPTLMRVVAGACARDPQLAALAAKVPIRLFLSASEPLPYELVREWRAAMPEWPLLNLYGATETTGIVAAFKVPDDGTAAGGLVPIGQAVGGNRLETRTTPAGLEELRIRSAQVASFDGSGTEPGVFATGDIVSARPGGQFDWVGRADDQVKINAVRINCGEVAAAIGAHAAVGDVFVEAGVGDEPVILHAFYEAKADVTAEELRAFAQTRLPAAAVPRQWMRLDAIPRLPNMKVDRQSLRALARGQRGPTAGTDAVAEVRSELRSIWSRRLNIAQVPDDARFHDLNGDSLAALLIVADIKRQFGVGLPLTVFRTDDGFASLAARIEEALGGGAPPGDPR